MKTECINKAGDVSFLNIKAEPASPRTSPSLHHACIYPTGQGMIGKSKGTRPCAEPEECFGPRGCFSSKVMSNDSDIFIRHLNKSRPVTLGLISWLRVSMAPLLCWD